MLPPGVLLEHWSDETRRSPGWVQTPLACDLIAYAYARRQHASCCRSLRSSVSGDRRPAMDQAVRDTAGSEPGLHVGQCPGAARGADAGDPRGDVRIVGLRRPPD